jgi:hypothetical protein
MLSESVEFQSLKRSTTFTFMAITANEHHVITATTLEYNYQTSIHNKQSSHVSLGCQVNALCMRAADGTIQVLTQRDATWRKSHQYTQQAIRRGGWSLGQLGVKKVKERNISSLVSCLLSDVYFYHHKYHAWCLMSTSIITSTMPGVWGILLTTNFAFLT